MSVLNTDLHDPYLANRFEVGVVDTLRQRKECGRLVNAMYSWRGYEVQDEEDHARGDDVTLHVSREQQVIATMTICHDSARGIPADALYEAEVDTYRARGLRVCEFTRLAVDPAHRSKEVLGALFCHAVDLAMRGGASEVVIEVNPRHIGFYKRVLKFGRIGAEKLCGRVNAPAILLHQELEAVRRQIAECDAQHRRNADFPQAYRALAGARSRTPASPAMYAS